MQVCISFPPPSYSELFEKLKGYKFTLPSLETIAVMIGLPVPIYATISQFTNEVSQVVQYWQSQCTMTNLVAIGKKLASVVGGELEKFLPKIPFLNLSILAVFDMDANELKRIVSDAYIKEKEKLLNALKAFLPLPIYLDLSIPDFEINTIIKSIYTYCISMLINTVVDLIKPVLEILEIATSLTLPTMPTLKELQAMFVQAIKDKVNEITAEVDQEIQNIKDDFTAIKATIKKYAISIQSAFDAIHLDGLPKIPLPTPFLPDFSSICYELRECTMIYFNGLLTAITAKIVDFVKTVLSVLKIQLPSICIELPES